MSEMVARVARALCAQYGTNPDTIVETSVGPNGEVLSSVYAWEEWEAFAMRAMEAMREPLPHMLDPGRDAILRRDGVAVGRESVRQAWEAAIDVARTRS